ncbi:MAG: AI-2E family transporter [Flavobacteriales bacterium]
MDNKIARGIFKAVLGLAGLYLLFYFLYQIQIIFIYLGVAAVIAIIGRPLVLFLNEKLRIPNIISAILTMLLFLLTLIGFISLFAPLITQQADNLSLLNQESFKTNLEVQVHQIIAYLEKYKIDLSNNFFSIEKIIGDVSSFLPNFLNSVLGIIRSLIVGIFSVLFISFFLLKDRSLLKTMLFSVIPDKEESSFDNVLNKTNNLLSRYFIGLIIQVLVMFTMYIIILLSFGIDNALIIAFMCSLMNLVPYIGPLVGAFIISLLTMSHYIGEGLPFNTSVLPNTGYVLFAYLIAQMIDNFINQPLIFSNSIKSHPLEVFIVIIIGGTLFGVIGMIVAVPTYTAIRVILKEFFGQFKWVQSITKNI